MSGVSATATCNMAGTSAPLSLDTPRYKDLVELLQQSTDAASLRAKFTALYPHIPIGPRADRFRNICERIAAPVKANKFSNPEALQEYLRKVWKPRVRNLPKECPTYPEYLTKNGLTESLLLQLLYDDHEEPTNWNIPDSCPASTFYSYLHPFLRSSGKTKDCSKTCIGRLYHKIDPYLSERNFRPDNAFRFVERLVSKCPLGSGVDNKSATHALSEEEDILCHHNTIVATSVDASSIGTCGPPHVSACSSNWAPTCESSFDPNEVISKVEPRYKRRNVIRREKRKERKIESLKQKLKQTNVKLRLAQKCIKKHAKIIDALSDKLATVMSELATASTKLKELENERNTLKNKVKRKDNALQVVEDDFTFSENTIEDLQAENENLKEIISSLNKQQLQEPSSSEQLTSSLDTKTGKHYSLPIRRLYYELLSSQVPASRVSDLVRAVVKCFFPDVDVSKLQLPKARCAGYMRQDELYTVEMAHKAHYFCSEIESTKPFHVNSDGTTLNQHKITGLAINDYIFSLNEVPDGSAESVIQDIEKELGKLRNIAVQLKLPFANSINWTLFTSSSSDSASTQKKFNKLLEERIEQDEVTYGAYKKDGLSLIKNFCAMHLGVNLRKAFMQAISSINSHQNTDVDTFVHEFAKEFGACGTPEYCVGSVKFPDFIQIQSTQSSSDDDSKYFKKCLFVHLERQVGSRYFVTAANASKALFLSQAALEFLKFNGISESNGNKLEKELYLKLHDPSLRMSLIADALMFYFIYADLVTLAKSNDLSKSAFDMRMHYLELQCFLAEVEKHPVLVCERQHQVFVSEPRLYLPSSKVNHRLKNICIWDHLFDTECSRFCDEVLFSKISTGASAMKLKLMAYASSHLPGGEFWEPDPDVRSVLSTIKPTNDICESILGLNDYLSTAIPNLDQTTRSTMVCVKKNKTIKWLEDLPESHQNNVTLLAMKSRHQVNALHKKEQNDLQQKRQELMLQAKKRREMLEKKAAIEREKLSVIHVITSVPELDRVFSDIDSSECSTRAKRERKVKILREQVRVRKKVLNQKVSMKFTQSGRMKPLNLLINEFKEVISCGIPSESTQNTGSNEQGQDYNPIELVGRHISHKFISEDSQTEVWYEGFIVGYDPATNMHELAYVEDDNCHYDLTDDLRDGDIIFLDDD